MEAIEALVDLSFPRSAADRAPDEVWVEILARTPATEEQHGLLQAVNTRFAIMVNSTSLMVKVARQQLPELCALMNAHRLSSPFSVVKQDSSVPQWDYDFLEWGGDVTRDIGQIANQLIQSSNHDQHNKALHLGLMLLERLRVMVEDELKDTDTWQRLAYVKNACQKCMTPDMILAMSTVATRVVQLWMADKETPFTDIAFRMNGMLYDDADDDPCRDLVEVFGQEQADELKVMAMTRGMETAMSGYLSETWGDMCQILDPDGKGRTRLPMDAYLFARGFLRGVWGLVRQSDAPIEDADQVRRDAFITNLSVRPFAQGGMGRVGALRFTNSEAGKRGKKVMEQQPWAQTFIERQLGEYRLVRDFCHPSSTNSTDWRVTTKDLEKTGARLLRLEHSIIHGALHDTGRLWDSMGITRLALPSLCTVRTGHEVHMVRTLGLYGIERLEVDSEVNGTQ